MKVKAERIENSQMVLEVEAEPEEVERSLEEAYHRLVKRADIPGFRRGKAPRDMLEHYVGRETLLENALEKLVPQLLTRAIDEQGIDIVAQPEVEVTKTDPVIFKATLPLYPTVELGSYREINIAPEEVTVSEEEVDKVIEQARYRQAPWDPVERPVKFGDLVIIDVMGSVEGKPLMDRKDLEFQVQQGLPIPVPGFAEKLEGVERGKEMEFSISLPSDYGVSELAGKECHFKVRISEVKEKKLPELDDEFARSIGQGFETLDALRDSITENIRIVAEQSARKRYEEKVIDAVVDSSHVEFPPVFVEQEIDRFIAEQERELNQNSMGLEDFLRISKKSMEEFRTELRPVASIQVARSLVISKVTEAEGIAVSDEEIDEEVERMVKGAGDQGEELRKLFQSVEARQSLGRMLVSKKTIEWLMEIASSGEESKPVTAEAPSGDDKAPAGETELISGQSEAT